MIARFAAAAGLAAMLWATVAAAQPAAAPSPAWEEMGVSIYESPKAAPAFALPALDGRTVRLEDYRGRPLLLFFWTTW
jgi:cytochrome oxidase Cu insertion factor (SCO1/SenC/PrrC family)